MTPEEALGPERVAALETVGTWLLSLGALVDGAETTVVTLTPITGAVALAEWEREVRLHGETWAQATNPAGEVMYAVDEASEAAGRDPAGAVVYPETHMRLVGWWLSHAWRLADLIGATIHELREWRVTTGAVTARALLEETGCLLYELRKLDQAWAAVKTGQLNKEDRAASVRNAMAPPLTSAAFGSRMKGSHPELRATNVMTYVQKLAKALERPELEDWYDWLSDAAHPAAGARIALASQPVVHVSGAVTLQFMARRPVPPRTRDGRVAGTDFTIAHRSADTAIVCGSIGQALLEHGLRLVDDVGLTTGAATLTTRRYWRDLEPVRGGRPCPCGRGHASDCGHWWDAGWTTLDVGRP